MAAIHIVQPTLMGCEDVAAYLGVYRATVRRWIVEEKIPAIQVGNAWVMHRDDVELFAALPPAVVGRPRGSKAKLI